jgi:hypothetical protein
MGNIQRAPTESCDVGVTEEAISVSDVAGLSFERAGCSYSSGRVGFVSEQVSAQK